MSISNKIKQKTRRLASRHRRVRAKVFGTEKKPRLCVRRSNRHIFAQLIDDQKNITLACADDSGSSAKGKEKAAKTKGKVESAFKVGEAIAGKALDLNKKKIVFDRAGYRYHGRVKSLAEGARKGGLEF